MVKIIDKIENILKTLGVPYYYGMPEFTGQEPDSFVTYDFYENPSQSADNTLLSVRYTVTINVIAPSPKSVLFPTVKRKFMRDEFTFMQSGRVPDLDRTYPYKIRRYYEFQYDMEENE